MSKDVLSLVVFAVAIVVFVMDKLPMATSAILGCIAMVVLGVCDFGTAFGSFASSTVLLLIGILIVGSAMVETGVAAACGRVLNKLSGSNERVLIAVSYLISCALSAFLTNATVLAIFMPIIMGMTTRDKRLNHMNIILPVLLGTAMGGICTLVGSSQQLTANGLIEELGYSMEIFTMAPVGLVLVLAGLLYILFVGYPLGKRIWGGRENVEVTIEAEQYVEPDKRKFVTMCVILAGMIVSYVLAVIPPAVTALAAALACIIFGCIPQKKAFAQVNWDVVFRLAGCLGLAAALKAGGGIDLLSRLMNDLIGGSVSPFALLVFVALSTQILSLVISNSTAILLVLPIALSMAQPLGLNPIPYALAAAYGSSMGLCSPLSGSTNAMSMAAGYKFRDYIKYGLLFDVISILVVIVFIPIFFSLTH